jgi:hypothetical protein
MKESPPLLQGAGIIMSDIAGNGSYQRFNSLPKNKPRKIKLYAEDRASPPRRARHRHCEKIQIFRACKPF